MYVLIAIACVSLTDCNWVEVKGNYKSLDACEAAIEKEWEAVKPGHGLLCYKREDIQT